MSNAKITCGLCEQIVSLNITVDQLFDWITNQHNLPHIQDHFPHLSDDEREIIISGICGSCFDKMFDEDDDE